jgi:hypothetical protein
LDAPTQTRVPRRVITSGVPIVVARCGALPGRARHTLDRDRRAGCRDGGTLRRGAPGGSSSGRTHRIHAGTRRGTGRRHRSGGATVIAGVLWITRTTVFATSTPHLGSGVTVRVHIAVGVRVGARLRGSRGCPPHWCSQRGRKYKTYQCLSHQDLHPFASASECFRCSSRRALIRARQNLGKTDQSAERGPIPRNPSDARVHKRVVAAGDREAGHRPWQNRQIHGERACEVVTPFTAHGAAARG